MVDAWTVTSFPSRRRPRPCRALAPKSYPGPTWRTQLTFAPSRLSSPPPATLAPLPIPVFSALAVCAIFFFFSPATPSDVGSTNLFFFLSSPPFFCLLSVVCRLFLRSAPPHCVHSSWPSFPFPFPSWPSPSDPEGPPPLPPKRIELGRAGPGPEFACPPPSLSSLSPPSPSSPPCRFPLASDQAQTLHEPYERDVVVTVVAHHG